MADPVWTLVSAQTLFAVMMSLPAMGQEGDILPVAGEWREQLDPPREVTQLPIAGFAVRGELAPTGPELRALLPSGRDVGEICVHARSVDGGYEAINTHLVPEGFEGPLGRLPFTTRHTERLESYGVEGLAVLVTEGACLRDSRNIPNVMLAFWNAAPDMEETIILLLNSLRAEEVFVYVGEGAGTPIRCAPVAAELRYSFDTQCAIPLARLPEGRTEVRILAMRNQQFDPEQIFDVVRPEMTLAP
jgi:hypothetical protein